MPFDAGSIVGTLALDVNPYRQGFAQASAIAQTFPSVVSNFLAHPLLGLAEIARQAFVGVASAVQAGFAFVVDAVKTTADQADRLNDMARNVGVSVEILHGLGLSAKQAGSSVEEVADAFKFLGKNVADAMSKDGPERKLFADFGIAITDVTGKVAPLEQIMAQLIDAIAETEDPTRRTEVAMTLLGRSGTNLVSTLREGTRGLNDQMRVWTAYGAVVTEQNAKAGDAFNDLLGEISIAWGGIKKAIGEPLIEGLTPALREVTKWMENNSPWLRSEINRIINEALKKLGELAAWFKKELPEIKKQIEEAFTGMKKQFSIKPKDMFEVRPGSIADLIGLDTFFPMQKQPVTYNVNVQTPQLNPKEASSEISRKLVPVIRQSEEVARRGIEHAVRHAAVSRGLRGGF
jgi:hypothetical protein